MKTLLLTLVLLSGGFTFAEEEQKIPVQETPSPAIVTYDVTGFISDRRQTRLVGQVYVQLNYQATRNKVVILLQEGHKESASASPYYNQFTLAIKDSHTGNIIYRTELPREEFLEKHRLLNNASRRYPLRIEFDTEAEEILSMTVTRPEF